jgi:hypothetical protein
LPPASASIPHAPPPSCNTLKTNKTMSTHLEKYIATVEKAIETLGVAAKTCRTDDPYKWYLHRGRANVVLFLRESTTHLGDKKDSLVMVTPMIAIPKDEEERLRLYTQGKRIKKSVFIEHSAIQKTVPDNTNCAVGAPYPPKPARARRFVALIFAPKGKN